LSSGRKDADDREKGGEFARAMDALDSVVPAKASKVSSASAGSAGPRAKRQARDRSMPKGAASEFHFPRSDEPLLARKSGVRAREFGRLRSGRLPARRDIDLHGCTRQEARRHLQREIAAAHRAREECVRVIHGRGSRSASGDAVLKRALPEWLVRPPLASVVRAFAPAQARDGGSGACYVLLCVSSDE
jgi:DNA-nicking Smr family endonuclease